MRQQLQRIHDQLADLRDHHEPLQAAIDKLLAEFSDALQPPFRRQIDYIHRGQRMIKIARTKIYQNTKLLKKILTATDPSWASMKELPVEIELKKALSQQLYKSSNVRSGDKLIIAVTEDGRDLAEEIILMCLLDNVDFELGVQDPLRMMHMINDMNDEQLEKLAQLTLEKYEGVKSEIIISSSTSPDIKRRTNPDRMKQYKLLNKPIHDLAMAGDLHYTLTRIPTRHDADLDEMKYEDYLELFFELCDQPWEEIQKAQEALKSHFDSAKELRLSNSDGTDLTLDITNMTFANSVIAKNIPGSEIFSAPVKTGVNGKVVAKGKFRYGTSDTIENITLSFKNGRIESFSAEMNEGDLEKIITADDEHGEGTRHLGEIGIGTNPHLRRHVINPLLVEKIGGSFHIALGSCYTYTSYLGAPVNLNNGNQSHSGAHWDLTTLLRGKDGIMELDGKCIQENGDWIGTEFDVLNKSWEALHVEDQPFWWKQKYSLNKS